MLKEREYHNSRQTHTESVVLDLLLQEGLVPQKPLQIAVIRNAAMRLASITADMNLVHAEQS